MRYFIKALMICSLCVGVYGGNWKDSCKQINERHYFTLQYDSFQSQIPRKFMLIEVQNECISRDAEIVDSTATRMNDSSKFFSLYEKVNEDDGSFGWGFIADMTLNFWHCWLGCNASKIVAKGKYFTIEFERVEEDSRNELKTDYITFILDSGSGIILYAYSQRFCNSEGKACKDYIYYKRSADMKPIKIREVNDDLIERLKSEYYKR